MGRAKNRTRKRSSKGNPETKIMGARVVDPAIRNSRNRRNGVVTQVNTFHQGPLPTPDDLQRYDLVHEGFAERIMTMAETEQNHRIDVDTTILQSKTKETIQNRRYAFGALILLLGVAVFGAKWIGEAFGIFLSSTTVLGIVVAFLRGRPPLNKEP